MAIFDVTFKIPARMQVDCDDEDDARDYIETIPLEQFQLLAIKTELLQKDDIKVMEIKKL